MQPVVGPCTYGPDRASQLNKAMEAHMPKGQQKSNRETRKPKKQKSGAAAAATVTSTFATPSHKSGQKR